MCFSPAAAAGGVCIDGDVAMKCNPSDPSHKQTNPKIVLNKSSSFDLTLLRLLFGLEWGGHR